jgi:prefoldin subunit 5
VIASPARPFRPFLLLALIATLVIAVGPRARAADGADPTLSGHWQIRGALHDADKALEEGRLDAAGQLYRQVVASTSAGDDQRAQGLYGVALVEIIEMSTAAEPRDPAEAGAALEELASSFPRFERGPEVAAARSCLTALSRADTKTESLSERIAELEAELAERTTRLAAKDAAAGDRVAELEAEGETLRTEGEALRSQLAELQEKLSSVEEELKKKEEALEKVKKTLVSGG